MNVKRGLQPRFSVCILNVFNQRRSPAYDDPRYYHQVLH